MSRLTGKCAAQSFAVLVYGHVYIISMVILKSHNKITDFFMILA